MKINTNSKKFTYLLLSLIIIVGICRFSYGFFVQKESFHSDEAWSFGLANSYYEPYIQYNDSVTEYKNTNTWLPSKTLRNYFTVQSGERFSFGSVYYNLSCDTHPPLYFFLLHFLSSFFPNHYIFTLGFIINMIAYVLMAIYLYKLLLLITKSKIAGLIGVFFSTFSLAMLCMTMFVRMYMLVATMALIYTYLNAKLFYDATYKKKHSSYIILGITSCVGALTDNFFLPYAFTITLIMCIGWIIRKEYKVFIKYTSCMLIGIGLSILIFPKTAMSALGMLGIISTSDSDAPSPTVSPGQKRFMPLWYQFKLAIIYINREFLGRDIITPFKTMFLPYLLCSIIIITILFCATYFIFRKEPWFINSKRNFIIVTRQKTSYFFKHFSFIILAMFLAIITVCFFAADKTDLYQFGNYGDRYLMVCYPAVMVLLFLLLYRFTNVIFAKKKKIAIIVLCILFCIPTICSNLRTCHYFMKTDRTIQLESISNNSDFVVVSSRKWLLVQYAARLINCNEIFFTQYSDLESNIKNIGNHSSDKEKYLIIDTTYLNDNCSSKAENSSHSETNDFENTVDQLKSTQLNLSDILNTCSNISFIQSLEFMGYDYVNGFKFYIYKIN